MRSRRQRLGQHFLRDARVATAIVKALAEEPPRVLEIGPGRGALTGPLVARFPQVRAVELDGHLAETLAARLGNPANLEVWHGDALHCELDQLAAGGPWQVAGNLPYAVATPLVRRLLRRWDLFPRVVVMVQREVAQRFLAPPGTPQRGVLSVEREFFAAGRRLFDVPPAAFGPPPRVVSAVVSFAPHSPALAEAVLERALQLAGAAFTQRRKKLVNALAGQAPPAVLARALEEAGCAAHWRPQEVTAEQWAALATALPRSPRGDEPCI